MSVMEIPAIYDETIQDCLACGKCMGRCPSLKAAGMSLLEVANGMRNVLVESEDEMDAAMNIYGTEGLVQAVRGCFFCERCVGKCDGDIDVCSVIYKSREVFQKLNMIPREAWSSVLVDQQWHIFSAYRAIYGVSYTDLTKHVAYEGHEPETDCEVAFFPGCSLAAYAPELTREVFETVEKFGGKCTMIDQCCGSPLKSAGFLDKAVSLADRIVEEVKTSGVKQIVFVCPGCKNIVSASLKAAGMDIDCKMVAEFLNEHGVEPKVNKENLHIFKSCQDRDASYLAATQKLLGIEETDDVPVICDGCCGAGGAVSAFDQSQQDAQVEHALCKCKPGETLVTMCPTCTYTFAARLMDGSRGVEVKNYLELVFENGFDWPETYAKLGGMWSGEYAAWLAQTFA